MKVSYYQTPSPIGEPIIKLLGVSIEEDCITSIEFAEVLNGFNFGECQIVRYLWRLGVKTEDIKPDCLKILDYIDRAIENESHIIEKLKIVRMHLNCLLLRQ